MVQIGRATLVAMTPPRGDASMRPRRVLQNPSVAPEPFDPAAFPGLDERLRADGGAASARWRELVATNRTIIADGATGTMLFANGLLFGDPPEVWKLVEARRRPSAHPPRLPGRRVADPHDQHVRWQPDAPQPARAPGPRRGTEPDRGDPPAQRGRRSGRGCPRRGRHRSERGDPRPDRTLDYDEAVDIFAEQAAALVAGGVVLLIRIETMSDLREIKAAIEGVRRVSPGIALSPR